MPSQILHRLCLAALLLLCTAAVAANSDPTQYKSLQQIAETAVKKTLGEKYSVLEAAIGDLNQDGIDDIGLILDRENPRVAVLLASPPDRYELGAISKAFCFARYHYSIKIQAQSLFVSVVHTLGPSEHTYQFSMKSNKLILVGLEESNLFNEQTNGYGKSVNYLTQEVIYWRNTEHKRREVKRKIPKSPLVTLSGFDCDTFEEPHGWIKDDFKFEP